jgi:hypothetical protein
VFKENVFLTMVSKPQEKGTSVARKRKSTDELWRIVAGNSGALPDIHTQRKPMTKKISVMIALLLMTGCATLSKDECLNADWYMIGFEDANSGYALDRIGQHRKACASVKVVPDMTAYEEGHRKGARQYCTRERGYSEGARGNAYRGICPLDLVDTFMQAYRDGQDRYQIEKQLDDMASAMVSIKHRIEEIDADIAYHEGEIISEQSDSDARAEHLRIIRELRYELSDLQIELVNMEEQHYRLDGDYHHLLNQHRRQGYQ